ncbi:hypothetical protein ACJX0J_015722, partial [Zea mays]
ATFFTAYEQTAFGTLTTFEIYFVKKACFDLVTCDLLLVLLGTYLLLVKFIDTSMVFSLHLVIRI